tara:strand:+ start:43054 stop:45072 length:2019 start_codon:yes stop_codon:yes gene_type:complete
VIRRIHFEGDSTACAKWLPFAKSKLSSLSRIYAGRKHWTWETAVSDARIRLEQNAHVQYIRIESGIEVYEFAAALDYERLGRAQWVMADLNFGKVKAYDLKGAARLEMRQSRGSDDDDWGGDSHVFAGQWGSDKPVPDEFNAPAFERWAPRIDWFQVPLPGSPEVAEKRARIGYSGTSLAISTYSRRKRHFDLNDYFYRVQDETPIVHNGRAVVHRGGGRAFVLPVTMPHSRDQYFNIPIEPVDVRIGTAAKNGEFYICGSHIGYEYKFTVYDKRLDLQYHFEIDQIRPDWVVDSLASGKWYWRGDGKRCISVQYGFVPGESLAYRPLRVDSGFHELEFELSRADNNFLEVVLNPVLEKQYFSERLFAIDYDLFDGAKRRALILEPWIANEFTNGADETVWGIIIYGKLCIIGDDGEIAEVEKTIPLTHAAWINDTAVDTFASGPDVSSHFAGKYGYYRLLSRVAALDLRASAIALYTTEQLPGAAWFDGGNVGRRWRIWNEDDYREKVWINDAGISISPAVDPLDSLESPPAGYVKFTTDHPAWGLSWEIVSTLFYQLIGPSYPHYLFDNEGTSRVYPSYSADGFRISPKKHFALYVHEGAAAHATYGKYPDHIIPFIHFDHVEWFRLDEDGNPAPIVSTHYNLYNNARGTSYQHGDGLVESMCANGMWVM